MSVEVIDSEPLGRRTFFKKILPIKNNSESESFDDKVIPEDHCVGRRRFFEAGVAITAGTALALNMALNGGIAEAAATPQTTKIPNIQIQDLTSPKQQATGHNNFDPNLLRDILVIGGLGTYGSKIEKTLENFSDSLINRLGIKKSSYRETAVQQVLMTTSQFVLSAALYSRSVEVGNQGMLNTMVIDFIKNNPLLFFAGTVVAAPLIEEFSRYSTSEIFARGGGRRWDMGMATSAVFALGHSFDITDLSNVRFKPSIPLPQISGGMFAWYLLRDKGFSHAAFGHALNNAFGFSIVQLGLHLQKGKS